MSLKDHFSSIMLYKGKRMLFYKKQSLAVALGCIITGAAFSTDSIQIETQQDKYLKTIDYIAHMAKDIYCYWDIKKEQYQVDWPTLIKQAKQKVRKNTSFTDFQNILTALASSLHDGHVNYIYSYLNKIFYIPIKVCQLEGGYFISQVDNKKMEPFPVDIHPGDRLLAVNGIDIDEYIRNKSQYISASTPHALQSYATSSLNSLEKFKTAPDQNL